MSHLTFNLQPVPVVRDQDGFFLHPELLRFWQEVVGEDAEQCTIQQWEDLCAVAGVVTKTVCLSSDPIDSPAYVAYYDNEGSASDWDPSPPSGWWLIEIGDSEDGPYAVWATHAAAAEKATEDTAS